MADNESESTKSCIIEPDSLFRFFYIMNPEYRGSLLKCNSIENACTIQRFLGHERLSTTMRYTLLTPDREQRPVDPLDLLPPPEPFADDTSSPADD